MELTTGRQKLKRKERSSIQMSSIFDIPEIAHEILIRLDGWERFSFAIVNRTIYKAYLFFDDIQGRIGNYRLTLNQYDVIVKIRQSQEKKIKLAIRTGFGRMVIIAGLIFENFQKGIPIKPKERVLLITNRYSNSNWIETFVKRFPDSDIKSAILNSSTLRKAIKSGISKDTKLVITTLGPIEKGKRNRYQLSELFGLVIIDSLYCQRLDHFLNYETYKYSPKMIIATTSISDSPNTFGQTIVFPRPNAQH